MKLLKTILFILVFFPFSLVIALGVGYYKLHHKHKTKVVLIQCWDHSEQKRTNKSESYTQAWVKDGEITTFVNAGIAWKHDGKEYFIKGDCQAHKATTEDDSILSPENYLGAQSLD